MPNYKQAFNQINQLINHDVWLKNNYPLPDSWKQLDGNSPTGEYAIIYWDNLINQLKINLQDKQLVKPSLDIIEILLDNSFTIKTLPIRYNSNLLLHSAVMNGHASLVNKLLEKGVDPHYSYTRNLGMMGSSNVSLLDELLYESNKSKVQSENFKEIGKNLFDYDIKNASMSRFKKAIDRGFINEQDFENHPVRVFHDAHKKQMDNDINKDRSSILRFFPSITIRKTSINEGMRINEILEHAQHSNNRSRKVMQNLGWIDESGKLIQGRSLESFLSEPYEGLKQEHTHQNEHSM